MIRSTFEERCQLDAVILDTLRQQGYLSLALSAYSPYLMNTAKQPSHRYGESPLRASYYALAFIGRRLQALRKQGRIEYNKSIGCWLLIS